MPQSPSLFSFQSSPQRTNNISSLSSLGSPFSKQSPSSESLFSRPPSLSNSSELASKLWDEFHKVDPKYKPSGSGSPSTPSFFYYKPISVTSLFDKAKKNNSSPRRKEITTTNKTTKSTSPFSDKPFLGFNYTKFSPKENNSSSNLRRNFILEYDLVGEKEVFIMGETETERLVQTQTPDYEIDASVQTDEEDEEPTLVIRSLFGKKSSSPTSSTIVTKEKVESKPIKKKIKEIQEEQNESQESILEEKIEEKVNEDKIKVIEEILDDEEIYSDEELGVKGSDCGDELITTNYIEQQDEEKIINTIEVINSNEEEVKTNGDNEEFSTQKVFIALDDDNNNITYSETVTSVEDIPNLLSPIMLFKKSFSTSLENKGKLPNTLTEESFEGMLREIEEVWGNYEGVGSVNSILNSGDSNEKITQAENTKYHQESIKVIEEVLEDELNEIDQNNVECSEKTQGKKISDNREEEHKEIEKIYEQQGEQLLSNEDISQPISTEIETISIELNIDRAKERENDEEFPFEECELNEKASLEISEPVYSTEVKSDSINNEEEKESSSFVKYDDEVDNIDSQRASAITKRFNKIMEYYKGISPVKKSPRKVTTKDFLKDFESKEIWKEENLERLIPPPELTNVKIASPTSSPPKRKIVNTSKCENNNNNTSTNETIISPRESLSGKTDGQLTNEIKELTPINVIIKELPLKDIKKEDYNNRSKKEDDSNILESPRTTPRTPRTPHTPRTPRTLTPNQALKPTKSFSENVSILNHVELPNGKGFIHFSDGLVYEGDFANGKINGYGKLEYPDGGVYIGEFKDGSRHGKGIYNNKNYKYEGMWQDDKRNGIGIIIYRDNGERYEGSFFENLPHGSGKYLFRDESIYIGQFFQGWRHGKGILKYGDNKTIYEGDWVHDNKTGKCCITYSNGIYEGEIVNGKKEGFGTYTYSNNDGYEGNWSNDKKHGQGNYYFGGKDSGIVFRGYWLNGYKHGTGYLEMYNVIYEEIWSEGKLIGKRKV